MQESLDLLTLSKSGGCAAKIGSSDLNRLVALLTPKRDKNLIVGIETSDDAGVYKLSAEIAQIHTADVITPVTSDPYLYGQVAAANALSDIYAMGGRPITVLNLCFFPYSEVNNDVFGAILKGGLDKAEEGGALLVGGHTIADPELKYGLSVTGVVHPDRVIRNTGAKPKDKLVLTKPIGAGVHVTASKQHLIDQHVVEPVIRCMATLNKIACEVMTDINVNGCTDVTGFGLAGHAYEMARGSGVGMRLFVDRIPLFPDTLSLMEKGVVTGLTNKNRRQVEAILSFDSLISDTKRGLFYDPQTSGGLLMAVSPEKADDLVAELHLRGVTDAQIIGECVSSDVSNIEVMQ